jgi:hypothetical protein
MAKATIGSIADDLKVAAQGFEHSSGKDRASTVVAVDQHADSLMSDGFRIDRG